MKVPTPEYLHRASVRHDDSFESWYRRYAIVCDIHYDPDLPEHQYDYRAYFAEAHAMLPGCCTEHPGIRLTDAFKKEGHPVPPQPEDECFHVMQHIDPGTSGLVCSGCGLTRAEQKAQPPAEGAGEEG